MSKKYNITEMSIIIVKLGMLDMHISLRYNSSAALKSKQLEGLISNKLEQDVRISNKMFEKGSQIRHLGHRPVRYVERSLVVFEVLNFKLQKHFRFRNLLPIEMGKTLIKWVVSFKHLYLCYFTTDFNR